MCQGRNKIDILKRAIDVAIENVKLKREIEALKENEKELKATITIYEMELNQRF